MRGWTAAEGQGHVHLSISGDGWGHPRLEASCASDGERACPTRMARPKALQLDRAGQGPGGSPGSREASATRMDPIFCL